MGLVEPVLTNAGIDAIPQKARDYMSWGSIFRHTAILIGTVFVVSAMVYLAVRVIAFEF